METKQRQIACQLAEAAETLRQVRRCRSHGERNKLLLAYDNFISLHPRFKPSVGTQKRNEWRRGWRPIVSDVRSYERKVQHRTNQDVQNALALDIDQALGVGVDYLRKPESERPKRQEGGLGLPGIFAFFGLLLGGVVSTLWFQVGALIFMCSCLIAVFCKLLSATEFRYIPIKDLCVESMFRTFTIAQSKENNDG